MMKIRTLISVLCDRRNLAPGTCASRALFGNWLAQVVVTRRCNLDCPYCTEFDNSRPHVGEAELERTFEHLARMGTINLELTGGEPLLHPGLYRLLRRAGRLGFVTRRLITNGFLLSRDRVAALNDAGLTHISVSVDGFASNSQSPKVVERITQQLTLLVRYARFNITISAVVGAGSPADLARLIAFCRERHLVVNLNLMHDTDGQLVLPAEHLRAFRDLVVQVHGRHYDLQGDFRYRMVTGMRTGFRCRAGCRYIYVDENQEVVWCSQTRHSSPRISIFDYTWDTMRRQFYTAKPCNTLCTVGCSRRVSRFDEWRDQRVVPDLPGGGPDDLQDRQW